MRQATLEEFSFKVKTVYVPIRNYPYKTRHGLSELQLRRRLEKQGWKVWRGGFIHIAGASYPAVKKRYELLAGLVNELFGPEMLDTLSYLSSVHHGMPDFLCYHPTTKQFKFVECKLGHEQLSARQVLTIQRLAVLGFTTEVHKLVEPCTKTREASVDLIFKKKEVMEKELTLQAFKRRER